jgi:hypothetical protein
MDQTGFTTRPFRMVASESLDGWRFLLVQSRLEELVAILVAGARFATFLALKACLGGCFTVHSSVASVRAVGAASVASLDARRAPQSATNKKLEREKKT